MGGVSERKWVWSGEGLDIVARNQRLETTLHACSVACTCCGSLQSWMLLNSLIKNNAHLRWRGVVPAAGLENSSPTQTSASGEGNSQKVDNCQFPSHFTK